MSTLEEDMKLLDEYASIEGAELGEYWKTLLRVWMMRGYYGEVFEHSVEGEIRHQAKCAREHYLVVESIVPRNPVMRRELVHVDELEDEK